MKPPFAPLTVPALLMKVPLPAVDDAVSIAGLVKAYARARMRGMGAKHLTRIRSATAGENCFKLEKRCQLFVGPDDEPVSVAAMRVCCEKHATSQINVT